MDVRYASTASLMGSYWVAASDRGVLRISARTEGAPFARQLMLAGYAPQYDPGALAPVTAQLAEYFARQRRAFDLAVDLRQLTPFQRTVLEAVMAVPYGAVRSYREIAAAIGKPAAARAVGGAVALCPISIVVPCHRIVRSSGTARYELRTNGPGAEERLRLIEFERAVGQ